MIYFDNAATTGVKPVAVINEVKNALIRNSANPGRSGHIPSIKTAEMIYGVREKAADFFGANGSEEVVFTMNCTHAINCVLKGVLRRGDHVVISSLEHNAVVRPLVKTGVSFDVAEVVFEDDAQTLKNFEDKIKPNTRLIFCTGASNVFGKILPIEKIGKLCLERHILFGVDAAQTAGVLPINIKKSNIDFLCIAPHKGLYAPMGTGLLIARKNLRNTIIEGGTGTNSIELFQPENLPERLESGTLSVPNIAGIGAGIEYVKKVGVENLYNKELNLIQKLYDNLKKIPEIKLYTPFPKKGDYVPLVSFNAEGLTGTELAEKLNVDSIFVRGGLHCAPMAHKQMGSLKNGTVRVSVASFNTEREIEEFLYVLSRKILKKT